MGGVPWSPRLQRLWDRLYLWKLLLKGYRGLQTSSRKIRRLMKKTGLPDAWKKSEVELQTELAKARAMYREAKTQKAAKWRKNYIQVCSTAPHETSRRLAKARACVSNHQRIEQKEETRRRRTAQGKGFSGGLIQIKVPTDPLDDESPWMTCTSRRNVEMGCMRENTLRYDQTRSPFPTPPMMEPLYSMFNGPDAESNSRSLLHGSLLYPSEDPFVRSFVDQYRRPPTLRDQPLRVSLDDHCYFWSRMRECKGSEPHGLHNGHFKAAVLSPMLASCDATFRAIPFSSGLVPLQWRHLMKFAIEKKPGEIRVTKMQTIQMMNSEFQPNNKKVGKAAMAYAERHALIPKGQCGSRKEHQAIDLALTKRLTWDLLLLQRRSAG